MDIHSNEKDRIFLQSIIKMISDYAKNSNANKDEVFMDIATTFVEMVSTQRYEMIGDVENEKAKATSHYRNTELSKMREQIWYHSITEKQIVL